MSITYSRATPSLRALFDQIFRLLAHLLYLFEKNAIVRWKRSPLNTLMSVVVPLQLILVIWLFQYLGFDRLIAQTQPSHRSFDISNSRYGSMPIGSGDSWTMPVIDRLSQMDTSSPEVLNLPFEWTKRKEKRVDPTIPIQITREQFGATCDSLCLLVGERDVSKQQQQGQEKQNELAQFVKGPLSTLLKSETFAFRFELVDILESQQTYIDNFMQYCGCVHVFLTEEAKRDESHSLDLMRDVALALQNRTSWANPTQGGGSTKMSISATPRNQTEHFVHNGAMIYLQHAMYSAFAQLSGKSIRPSSFSLRTQEFPVKHDGSVNLTTLISSMMIHVFYPTYFFLAIITTLQSTALLTPVVEKEKKICPNLQMAGCNMYAYHLSWSFISLFECLASILLIMILILAVKLFVNTDIVLFALVYVLSAAAMIPLLQIMGLFFSKSRTVSLGFNLALLVVTGAWVFVRIVFAILPVTTLVQHALYVLIPPVAFLEYMYNVSLAESQIVSRDAEAVRLGWGTMMQGSFPLNPTFSSLSCILILIADAVIYQLLLMYMQNVVPQEVGIAEKPWVIFTRRFWLSTLFGNHKEFDQDEFHDLLLGDDEEFWVSPDPDSTSGRHESSSSEDGLTQSNGIHIRNLFKTFKQQKQDSLDNSSSARTNQSILDKLKNLFRRPQVIAVDGLTLEIPSGQIFALLGANGAGKSTTLNMLTGLLSPNFGTATINGYNIREDMDIIRRQMGICMQENTVYEKMTGYEHMKLFAAIKGIPRRFMRQEIERKLESVDLWKHRNKMVSCYSGGMKRRLTFALAILGNPKIIILDETTAGTDPANRQRIWKILQRLKMRPNTTILMTSHSMEEVDILCDTIAVMKKGRLEVVGSSLHLKQHYGIGYHLTCNVMVDSQIDHAAVEHRLRQFVHSHFVELDHEQNQDQEQNQEDLIELPSLISNEEREEQEAENIERRRENHKIRMVLPYSAVHKFPTFLRNLESQMDELQIASYGLNITTLEEVFLRINEELDTHPTNADGVHGDSIQ